MWAFFFGFFLGGLSVVWLIEKFPELMYSDENSDEDDYDDKK